MTQIKPQEVDQDGARMILLEVDGLDVAMFPESKRHAYKHLIYLAGVRLFVLYSKEEQDKYRHLTPAKKTREKKDKSTPLFGDLPNVYKS